jgi:hypothetical protein
MNLFPSQKIIDVMSAVDYCPCRKEESLQEEAYHPLIVGKVVFGFNGLSS